MSPQYGFLKDRASVTKFTSYVLNCMEKGVQVDAVNYILISPRHFTKSPVAVEKTG
jgi:hypothetical protein